MSLKLILMRHAKSGWDDPVEDHDRPLNSRGRISAEVMGKWLQAKGHLPQEALVSTARRTTETFRGLGIAPQKVKFLSSLYHPSAQGLFAALRSATEQTVLMVSHNPGIAEFAELLAKQPPKHERFFDFPTCATWVCGFDVGRWKDIQINSGINLDLAIPRELIQ